LLRLNPFEFFKIERKIARGSFGQVYEVKELQSGLNFAAKVMQPLNSEDRRLILNEYVLTKLSNHPNIVKYYLIYEHGNEIWIIQELMSMSLTYLLCRAVPMPEKYIVYIMREVLLALDFIHQQYRLHRDIKSDNVLLDFSGNVKLCDLGFAAQLTSEQENRSTLAGSPCWLAPEVIKKKPYDTKVDIWSFGVLGIELVEGEPPRLRKTVEEILHSTVKVGVRLKNDTHISQELANLINSCLRKEPEYRRTAEDMLQDPIMKTEVTKEEFAQFVKERYHSLI
jgi:serine/threonine protein kinase